MEVHQSSQHRIQNGRNLKLTQLPLRYIDQVDYASGNAVLEHDPQVVILEVMAVELDDVLVVAQFQNLNFLLDGLDFGDAGGRQDLYGVQLARGLVQGLRDATVGALAQHVQQLEDLIGVGGLAVRQKRTELYHIIFIIANHSLLLEGRHLSSFNLCLIYVEFRRRRSRTYK